MRGRKPKPTNLKILEGNPGKRALPKNEPKLGLDSTEPPADLTDPKNAIGLAEWKRIAHILAGAGVLTEGDKTALMAYCLCFQRWIDAEAKVREHGVFQETPNGYLQINPYMTVVSRCMEQMKSFMVEFGLTPSSRVRLSGATSTKDKVDPLMDFIHDAKKRG